MSSGPSRHNLPQDLESIVETLPPHENITSASKVILILDGLKRREDIIGMLEDGVTDYWLPIPTHRMMPPSLDPEPCEGFFSDQHSFLSQTFELNQQHWNLNDQAMVRASGGRLPKITTYRKILGQGRHAAVAEVKYKGDRDGVEVLYAIKRFQRQEPYKEAEVQLTAVKREIEVLKRIDHDHCIRFMGSYTDKETVGVVMDPAADCNLETYLRGFDRQRSSGKEMVLASFFGCLANALEYLHYTVQIRHKDIKPQNILVKGDRVMFTDFGQSLDWSKKNDSKTQEEEKRSPVYCAPEAAKGEERGSKSDIWPLGCVFLEMAAVVHGKPSTFVKAKLSEYGADNFRECQQGIEDAIAALREHGKYHGTSQNSMPLGWIEKMLKREKDERWNSRQLYHGILQCKGQSNLAFCGMCCNEQRPTVDELNESLSSASIEPRQRVEKVKLHDERNGAWREVQLTRRSDISGNWVSRKIVNRWDLEMRPCSLRRLETGGKVFESTTNVKINFTTKEGGGESDVGEFWVTMTEAPFELLVGDRPAL